jgi:purine-binding chemotaxis protein CheW
MTQQFMTFYIGDDVYGINILGIREINYSTRFTPVPLSKEWLVGLLNLRGQIVTTLDMGFPLGYDQRQISNDTSLLVMKTSAELSHVARKHGITTHDDIVGFLVDQIGDVISAEEKDIEPVPAHLDSNVSKFLDGVVKREGLLVGLINVPELLKYQ